MEYKITYFYVIFMALIPLSKTLSQIKGDYIWVAGSQKNYTEVGGYDAHIMDFNIRDKSGKIGSVKWVKE